ncbi:MAG: nickel-responsive transcriptional regulator NikR [Candidatus Edwardsbacteria bacterium]
MSKLKRFSISLDENLVAKFDKHIEQKDYPTRSKAIGDLIREDLVKREWTEGREVAGVVTLVYNHHKRELVNTLTNVQHDFYHLIISTQHIHLDHDNCLEIVVVRGKSKEVEKLANTLRAVKGVKHGRLSISSTGREII